MWPPAMDGEDFVRGIYFDNAATSPMRPEVLQSMSAFFTEICGIPSSLHMPGQRAKRAVEEARYTLAASLGAEPCNAGTVLHG
ncbi:MAG: aminotransferase class V-fold PLP-dependent enzyme [Desulfobacterales bacterium]|nr:aminotransferase class V-fold PLP-dependent enzyme [Desulfobacterales bacterium]